jgi:hypothetical protein
MGASGSSSSASLKPHSVLPSELARLDPGAVASPQDGEHRDNFWSQYEPPDRAAAADLDDDRPAAAGSSPPAVNDAAHSSDKDDSDHDDDDGLRLLEPHELPSTAATNATPRIPLIPALAEAPIAPGGTASPEQVPPSEPESVSSDGGNSQTPNFDAVGDFDADEPDALHEPAGSDADPDPTSLDPQEEEVEWRLDPDQQESKHAPDGP